LFSVFIYASEIKKSHNTDTEIVHLERIIALKETLSRSGGIYVFIYLRGKQLFVEPYKIEYDKTKIILDVPSVHKNWFLFKKDKVYSNIIIPEIHLKSSSDIEFK